MRFGSFDVRTVVIVHNPPRNKERFRHSVGIVETYSGGGWHKVRMRDTGELISFRSNHIQPYRENVQQNNTRNNTNNDLEVCERNLDQAYHLITDLRAEIDRLTRTINPIPQQQSLPPYSNSSRQQSSTINLSTCQDNTDYLVSQDDLTEFPRDEIVSIKIDNITHCFPRDSILMSMVKGPWIFSSQRNMNSVMDVLRNRIPSTQDFDEFSRLLDTAYDTESPLSLPIKDYLKRVRLLKWPLGGTMLISYLGYENLVNERYNNYKLVKGVELRDGASLRAHSVGAVHGHQIIYNIIPINQSVPSNIQLRNGFYTTPQQKREIDDLKREITGQNRRTSRPRTPRQHHTDRRRSRNRRNNPSSPSSFIRIIRSIFN